MDGREIPGFYYDREKKKYFKIQAGHKVPANYKYTKSNIKKEAKRVKIEKQESARAKRRKLERVVAPHKTSLPQACLDREIGHSRRSYYMQSVWPSACASQYQFHPVQVYPMVEHFDSRPGTKVIYKATRDFWVSRTWPHEEIGGSYNADDDDFEQRSIAQFIPKRESQPYTRMNSPISSLNILPASGAMVVTTFGSDRPPVIYLTDPERDGPFVGEQFTPRHCPTVWTSSPMPTFSVEEMGSIPATNTELIAVGASKDLQLYSRPPSGTWDCNTALKSESDVLALEWLSPTTISIGHRDGKIVLYDTRSQGSTHILSHPTPISNLRRADDFTRIVCAGICNTLTVYDMRKAQACPPQKKRRMMSLPFQSSSAFITRFDYKNNDTSDLGMDVHPHLGLVAAADEDNNLNIWNLYTAERIRSFSTNERWWTRVSAEEPEISEIPRIKCVKFLEDHDERGTSVYATTYGGINRYGL